GARADLARVLRYPPPNARGGGYMRFVGLLFALVLWGCPQTRLDLPHTDQRLGPVAVGDHLVYADRSRDELVIVDVSAGEASGIARVTLGLDPDRLVPLPDGAGLLALASADEAVAHVDLATNT